MARPIEDRLWEKVERTASGCWIFNGARGPAGYGYITSESPPRTLRAHRAAWEVARGPIPQGLRVLHRCDVRSCVNPDHLFLGTNADNSADMLEKGRSVKGERHPNTKVTDAQAREIRGATGKLRDIGDRYGVSESMVSLIKRGLRRGSV